MTINIAVRDKWAAALESGDYKQGFNQLCSNPGETSEGYCCWGVLSELAVAEGVITAETVMDVFNRPRRFYENSQFYPPMAVLRWLGISEDQLNAYNSYSSWDPDGAVDVVRQFALFNDGGDMSFADIAKKVRELIK